MKPLTSPSIGFAAEAAVDAYNEGGLQTLLMRAGLDQFQPASWYGKSALVAKTIRAAKRAAAEDDEEARTGLNEFVRLVAETFGGRLRPARHGSRGDLLPAGSGLFRRRPLPRSKWTAALHVRGRGHPLRGGQRVQLDPAG
ncbi:hypothetical protein [Nonomuraea dietziae]|uniref:hypothetical protein n=1 Tax=Nonomuraea dietziae TaxID=65515 RepID=UPI0034442B24